MAACLDCGGSECICRLRRELRESQKRVESLKERLARTVDNHDIDGRALVKIHREAGKLQVACDNLRETVKKLHEDACMPADLSAKGVKAFLETRHPEIFGGDK